MSFSTSRTRAAFLAAILATAATGCGSNEPRLVTVEGTVTLGGQPLTEADVIFQPANSRPSIGTTDANGHYKLQFAMDKEGVLEGRHKVTITTFVEPDSDYEAPDRRAGRPERVPAKYNHESTLEVEVSADRSEPFDFALESDGEIYTVDARGEIVYQELDESLPQ